MEGESVPMRSSETRFVVKLKNGDFLTVKDAGTKDVEELKKRLKDARLAIEVSYNTGFSMKDGTRPIIEGFRIASGADKTVYQVVDPERKTVFVMLGPATKPEGVGGTNFQCPLDPDFELPVEKLNEGAYRYYPLVDDLTLFPDDVVSGKAKPLWDLFNKGISLGYGFFGDFIKAKEMERMKEMTHGDIHPGNVKLAVYDSRPAWGGGYWVPLFKWREQKGKRNLTFGLGYVTVEVLEV